MKIRKQGMLIPEVIKMYKNGKEEMKNQIKQEREISPVFSTIDTDLARDNLESDFDMTAADVQDL